MKVKSVNYNEIVTPELSAGAYIHDAYIGFKEDYLTLHCLLRLYQPNTIFEIGTNIGEGVNVMATARPYAQIYSLDLPFETMKLNSKQYPIDAAGNDRVGSAIRHNYTQLRGDSMAFKYSEWPCDAYFIDGEHTEVNVAHETKEILKCDPKLIVYHDADMPDVLAGIIKGVCKSKKYEAVRVEGTRILYLKRK